MKWKNSIALLILIVSMSGCVVFSFYPIYTPKDLFPNDYLLGNYMSDDSVGWRFTHDTKKVNDIEQTDSTGYWLKVDENKDSSFISTFEVHLIRIDGVLLADFILVDYPQKGNEVRMFDLHIVPVHTFAKVVISGDMLTFKWFNGDWLEKLIEGNKLRIRHENNGDLILLTAKSHELQKFVRKYLHSDDAFEDGLEVKLTKLKK
jgi:hypothetical protein